MGLGSAVHTLSFPRRAGIGLAKSPGTSWLKASLSSRGSSSSHGKDLLKLLNERRLMAIRLGACKPLRFLSDVEGLLQGIFNRANNA